MTKALSDKNRVRADLEIRPNSTAEIAVSRSAGFGKGVVGMEISAAYVMAGGQSRRMGRDKLFMHVDGVPLLDRTLQVCHSLFDDVYIVARQRAKFGSLKYDVFLDAPGAEGPMAGIITALRHCTAAACFVAAADLPDLDNAVITTLLLEYAGEQYLGVAEPGRCQPLCGIYAVSSLPVFLAAAKRGDYTLHTVLTALDHRFVQLNIKQWRNVNWPIDRYLRRVSD